MSKWHHLLNATTNGKSENTSGFKITEFLQNNTNYCKTGLILHRVYSIFKDAPSSDSDLNCYINIKNLENSIFNGMRTKIATPEV